MQERYSKTQDRRFGMQKMWKQDRRDAGEVEYRTGGIQDRWVSGQVGFSFRTGGLQDKLNAGQVGGRTGWMQDWLDAGLGSCRTGGMHDRRDEGQEG